MSAISEQDIKSLNGPSAPVKTRYTLIYRTGNELGFKWTNFDFKGDLNSAIARGRDHCLKMNMRFLRVEPFLRDLDLTEQSIGKGQD